MNIHDEVIGQCKPYLVEQNMADIAELSKYDLHIKGSVLDIPVDFKTGDNWADAEEINL